MTKMTEMTKITEMAKNDKNPKKGEILQKITKLKEQFLGPRSDMLAVKNYVFLFCKSIQSAF